MKEKTAIVQCADAGPVESLQDMLEAVGYRVYLPSDSLRATLRSIGCDTVLSPKDLTRGMGYDPVVVPEASHEDMMDCDLYVDVKAHRCYDKVVKYWPNLADRVLWYRINGGKPEHVVNQWGDCGDEVNPPCPVLTPNQWYRGGPDTLLTAVETQTPFCINGAYCCWPPFRRFSEYSHKRPSETGRGPRHGLLEAPICLIHNLQGWGYGALVERLREQLGVRCYGTGSPDGLIQHREVPVRLSSTLCMVHLKSNDAPGYAIYEALAAGCPVVCTRRLIWRCRMGELLIPDETCLVFDRETHAGLSQEDVRDCAEEVSSHLKRLRDPVENRRIGENGRERLKEIMWCKDRPEDVESLRRFMEHNFGG